MPLETFTRSDTAPLRHRLTRKADDGAWGVPNFAGATVRLRVYDGRRMILLERAGVFEDVAGGIVRVGRTLNDLQGTGVISAGYEHEVTYADGTTESYPKDVLNPVLIVD